MSERTLKLTKRVPPRTKTAEFKWVRRNFLVMGDTYRRAREGMRKAMDTCSWCGHKLEDGEPIGLACGNSGNVVLCDDCAVQALESCRE